MLIVTDLKRGDLASLAGAYARLIEAAGGGTLGLFTAIQRLKAVHARIADRLARAGLPLDEAIARVRSRLSTGESFGHQAVEEKLA